MPFTTISLPVWPVEDEPEIIDHPFNESRPNFGANKRHEGGDLRARAGKRIRACEAGKVAFLWTWQRPDKAGRNAYGNYLHVEHARPDGSTYRTYYCHLGEFASGISVGQRVAQGELLGLADSTGNVFPVGPAGAHLHLNLTDRVFGLDGYVLPKVLDPGPYLRGQLPIFGGAPAPAQVTNQQVVNRLYALATQFGLGGDELVTVLGWAAIYANRSAPFDRARVGRRPGPTDAVWAAVVAALEELLS